MHCKLPGHWSRQCPNKKLPSSNNCPPSPTSEDEFGFRIISQSLDINSSFMDSDEMYSTSDTNSSNVRFTTGMDRSFRNLEQCPDNSGRDSSISSSGSNKRKRDDPDMSDKINEFPDGFSFQKKKYTLNNDHRTTKGVYVGYYKCAQYRKGKCKARLIVRRRKDGSACNRYTETRQQKGDHVCLQSHFPEIQAGVEDARAFMKSLAETKALNEVYKTANEISREVTEAAEKEYAGKAAKFLTHAELQQTVYGTKIKEFGSMQARIQAFPMANVAEDDERFFFQFLHSVVLDGVVASIIGWAHPTLLFLLRGAALSLFMDCTFRVVPHGFAQLLIIMVYAPMYDLYVPVWYILLPSKDEWVYREAIRAAINATNKKLTMKVSTVCMDFEKGLRNAVLANFPGVTDLGCYFHWKQAMNKRLKELGVPKDIISSFLGPNGPLNLLTEIPIPEIIPKGIPYIRAVFDERGYKKEFDAFWLYFIKTWMVNFPPKLWNYTRNIASEVVNRTNNPVEHYNLTLNEAFPTAHPSMDRFLYTIKEQAVRFAKLLWDI